MALSKVRVQLLNAETDEVIQDVVVLTSADCVTFENGKTFQELLDVGLLKGDKGDTGAKGATGAIGPKGDTGAKGADGSKWLNGTVAPTTQGVDGDWYLNTSNSDIYQKASGTWSKKGNIKGATGATGAKGEKGEPGSAGAKGDTGAKGATGTRGSKWYSGTAITGTSTTGTIFNASGITDALVEDHYFNTSTGNVYKCTTPGAASVAKWVFEICLKGATGATGAKGDKGDTGARGATGATGPAGKDGDNVKFGTDYANASDVKIFMKKM